MRYISLIIGSILILASCNEVKVAGNDQDGGVVTAAFPDSVVTVFENAGTGVLEIELSRAVSADTKIRVEVCEENNIRENQAYFLVSKELTVAGGEKTARVEYSLVDDRIVNPGRSFVVKLVFVNGGAIDATRDRVRVKVLDDESEVAVGFESTAQTCSEKLADSDEASWRYEIPVNVSGTFSGPLQFQVAVYPTDSPEAAVENIHFRLLESTFIVSRSGENITVPVEIIDDDLVNVDRAFVLEIKAVIGGEIYTSRKRCRVTIKNDDRGIYFGKTALTMEEQEKTVKIPVKLTQISDTDITFTLTAGGSAVAGTDYALQDTWTIEAGQDSVEIEVELKHAQGVSPDRTLQLEFGDMSEGVQVSPEGPECAFRIWDVDTEVDLKYAEWGVLDMRGSVVVPVELAGPLEHDVILKLDVPQAEGVDVTVMQSQVTIVKGNTSASIEIRVNQLMAKNFTFNLTGIRGASAGRVTGKVSQCALIALPGLTVASFSSEQKSGEPAGSGVATAATDGNEGTYWHSEWSPNDSQLPQWIVVKVPDRLHIVACDIVRRLQGSNSDTRKAEIYLSNDQDNWGAPQGILEWDAAKTANREEHVRKQVFDHIQQGGFIKINVTEGTRHYGQVGEVIVYGYSD